jgi:centrosomal protein CEP76
MSIQIIPFIKEELIGEHIITEQIQFERKHEQDSLKEFYEYANQWWEEYKLLRESHKSRLVKLFAECEDRFI